MISKKLIFPVITFLVFGVAFFDFGIAYAQTPTPKNPMSDLVTLIAQKFKLDQGQVQTVFDEYRNQKQQTRFQDMQKRTDDRLTQAVKDGKLTEAQKQAVLTKHAELKAKHTSDSFNTMTIQQRKEAMQKEQTELTTWAQSQGIDIGYVMKFGMFQGGFKDRPFKMPIQ